MSENAAVQPDIARFVADCSALLPRRRRGAADGRPVFRHRKMISENGGATIPMFIDDLEAGCQRAGGMAPHLLFDRMGLRVGEKAWLA